MSLAQIDRIEILRGPASSLYGADAVGGVVQIFTRRGDGAPRWNAGAEVGGYRSNRRRRRRERRARARSTTRSRSAARAAEACRRVAPGDQFGSFNPDRDGFRRDSATLQSATRRLPGIASALHLLETRLNAQFDSAEFDAAGLHARSVARFSQSLVTARRVARLPGRDRARWTTTLQAAHAVDDLTSGGNL